MCSEARLARFVFQAEIVTSSEKAPSTAAALASVESNLSGDHRQDSRRSKWSTGLGTKRTDFPEEHRSSKITFRRCLDIRRALEDGLSVLDDLTQLMPQMARQCATTRSHVYFAGDAKLQVDTLTRAGGSQLTTAWTRALNPFKHIPGLYDEEILKNFITTKPSTKPHVFSTSNASYRGICDRHKSQTVLISGESGAGKTETTKFVMKFLALAGSADGQVTDVEKQVLESNPLLEAFGNARTLRNDNSSRFGKFIELQSGSRFHIGALLWCAHCRYSVSLLSQPHLGISIPISFYTPCTVPVS
ncbi:XI-I [Symbiodinium sp. CCMP2592]|nr:XI-I [Symbiodinium sp. CCMP2592]